MSNSNPASLGLPRAMRQVSQEKTRKLSGAVKPLFSGVAVLAISAMLVVTIFLTRLSMHWITFLTGVLVAAVLAEATRLSRAEWALMRRTAQLSAAREKLEKESRLRKASEQAVAAARSRLNLMDDALPAMVLLVDADGRCRYQNRSFRDWMHFRPEQIEGLHLNEVVGVKIYQEIAAHVRQALEGKMVDYQRQQKMPDGSMHTLHVVHVPQFADGGKVTGFYLVADDLTEYAASGAARAQAAAPAPAAQHAPAPAPASVAQAPAAAHAAPAPAEAHLKVVPPPIIPAHDEAAEMVAAIEKNEFRLFCQAIAPLGGEAEAEFHEILVRLMEEEEGLMPPGAFFPLAEEYGMMSRLDRWVVQHVAEWVGMQVQQRKWRKGSLCFINVADETIMDPGFPDYLEVTLHAYGIPGDTLCFEIPVTQLTAHGPAVAGFAQRIRRHGARIAVSGCGHDDAQCDAVEGFQPDFVKIDGGTLLGIAHDAEALARVTAVNQAAKRKGVRTIAEMVESQEVLGKLREIGVDFAQGFGISHPRPLSSKAAASPEPDGGPASLVAAGA